MTTRLSALRAALFGLGLLFCHDAPIRAAESAAPAAGEQWFVIRIGGTPVGTASERWARTPSETVFQAQMNVSFSRMGTPLSMSILTEESCDPQGKFIRARMESSVSNLSASASLDGDSVRYQSSAGGAVRRRALPWNPDAVTEMLGRQHLKEWLSGKNPETTLIFFDIAEGDFRTQRLVRGAQTRTLIAGAERTVVEVEEFDEGAPTPTSTSWYETNGDYDAVRSVVRQLGVEIEIARVTTAELEAIQIEPSFDIIKRSMVPCAGFPTPASRMETVTLVVDFPGPLPPESMDGPNQLEIERDAKSIELRLTRATSRKLTIPAEKRDIFLMADRYIQSDAKEIRAVADSLRDATRKDPWVLARAVTAWVDGHISKKGMEHGYASALDVYRSRAGDCTEHSLLTTAILRAAGVPARPVVGLAYSEADRAFVGHMWLEAYVDEWRTLDALNLGIDPIRIRVYAPESNEGLGERDLMRAYGVMAGVKVRATDHRER